MYMGGGLGKHFVQNKKKLNIDNLGVEPEEIMK